MYQTTVEALLLILNAMGAKCKLPALDKQVFEHLLYNLVTSDESIVGDIKFLRTYMREGAKVDLPECLANSTQELIRSLNLNPTLSLVYAKDFVHLVKANAAAIKCDLAAEGWAV